MSLKTHIEFVSDSFPSYPNEDEEINPGIWGKRLAEYLIDSLPSHGITPKEPYPEDWGWEIPIENKDFPMFIGCSNQLEQEGNQFLVFIDPSKSKIRKGLFKKIDTTAEITRVSDALEKILSSHDGIRESRWWDENEL
ncbi:hypothetical protein [Rubellicoccus peritrichatus]|uniref:Uncharacterized protein n=1 Tax=Rubellicoccus peritrichatus TaxID=3080537 RepID=A0AAQ3L8M2_9BACT|nr:hypothetical protein [Puniceicoccus sp. CR14]WOO41669.1 hypothetical protein RZN69_01115 [Puniceicoccus sp. CR14]